MSEIIKKFKVDSSFGNKALSRYKNLYRLVDSDNNTYIETPDRLQIKSTNRDSFYCVERGYEDRLDLISFKFYGTALLWWVIAEVNGIDNPLLVSSGTVLRIPPISSLYGDGGVLE